MSGAWRPWNVISIVIGGARSGTIGRNHLLDGLASGAAATSENPVARDARRGNRAPAAPEGGEARARLPREVHHAARVHEIRRRSSGLLLRGDTVGGAHRSRALRRSHGAAARLPRAGVGHGCAGRHGDRDDRGPERAHARRGRRPLDRLARPAVRGAAPRGFAVAGAGRKFHWANARIEGDTVVLTCDAVTAPVAVRYAWGANPPCDLAGATGLPAPPFRTDRWPGVTEGRKSRPTLNETRASA